MKSLLLFVSLATVTLAVVATLPQGTISARDYTLKYSTTTYANRTDFCTDWVTQCSSYINTLGGTMDADCVFSQVGPAVKVYCGGSTAKGPTVYHDYTSNVQRFVTASLVSGPSAATSPTTSTSLLKSTTTSKRASTSRSSSKTTSHYFTKTTSRTSKTTSRASSKTTSRSSSKTTSKLATKTTPIKAATKTRVVTLASKSKAAAAAKASRAAVVAQAKAAAIAKEQKARMEKGKAAAAAKAGKASLMVKEKALAAKKKAAALALAAKKQAQTLAKLALATKEKGRKIDQKKMEARHAVLARLAKARKLGRKGGKLRMA